MLNAQIVLNILDPLQSFHNTKSQLLTIKLREKVSNKIIWDQKDIHNNYLMISFLLYQLEK